MLVICTMLFDHSLSTRIESEDKVNGHSLWMHHMASSWRNEAFVKELYLVVDIRTCKRVSPRYHGIM